MIAFDLHGLLVACSVLVCRMCASFGSQNHAALVNFSTFLLKEVIKYEFQYSHIINYLSGFFFARSHSHSFPITLAHALTQSHALYYGCSSSCCCCFLGDVFSHSMLCVHL